MSYLLRWVGIGLMLVGITIAFLTSELLTAGLLIIIGLCIVISLMLTDRPQPH